jgi:anaerobic magnesium-protoporphyrin IX monomethyl ester cyclase
MSKILFIDPRGWQGAVNGNAAFPNVGIAYLIPSLLKDGFDVAVIDLNNELRTDSEVLSIITEFQPDIISFSVKTATIKDARKLARQIKQLFPKIPIILGGPHTTIALRELVTESWYDIIFLGEGEDNLPILCRHIVSGESIEDIEGVITKKNVLRDLPLVQSKVIELDQLSFPNYDLFSKNVKDFLCTNYPLVTTRGCIFKCIYCSVPEISGNKFRKRSPENIIDELKWAKQKYHIHSFEIIDDAFNLDIERSKQICRALIKENLGLTWSCPNGLRADRVDTELAELLFKAGCKSVMVGVESADPLVLASVKKGESIEDIEKGIRIFQAAGIHVGGYFIIGLPGDSLKSQKKSLEFVKKLGITAHFNMLVPYPGTNLWRWAQKNAHFLHDIEDGLHFSDSLSMVDPVFETDDFPAAQRQQAYEMVHTRIGRFDMLIPPNYKKRIYYWQMFKLLWKYNRGQLLHPILEVRCIKWLKKVVTRYDYNN